MKTKKSPWASGSTITFQAAIQGQLYEFTYRNPLPVHEMTLSPAGEGLSRTMSKIATDLSVQARQ